MAKTLDGSKLPIVSVDVPSGWNVESGNVTGDGFKNPSLLSKKYRKEYNFLIIFINSFIDST